MPAPKFYRGPGFDATGVVPVDQALTKGVLGDGPAFPVEETMGRQPQPNKLYWVFFVGTFLYAFLLALELLSRSVGLMAGDAMASVSEVLMLPAVGVCVGILATAAVQSSTALTAILVALVAAGTLTMPQAVPVVIGANIGTTFTALLVSLSFINMPKEFRKGLSAATLHHLFNLLTALIILPLELSFGWLGRMAGWLSSGLLDVFGRGEGSARGLVQMIVAPVAKRLVSEESSAIFWLAISLVMLFGCIILFRMFLRVMVIGEMARHVDERIFGAPWRAMGIGAGLTAFIHSSTVTSSLCVPVAATGKVGVRKVLPFLIGANVGTTLTAVIGALAQSEAALALGLAHLLFNVIPATLLMVWPGGRGGLVGLARQISRAVARRPALAVVYIATAFFAAPIVIIFLVRA